MERTKVTSAARRLAAIFFIIALLWVPAIGFLYGAQAAIGGLLVMSPFLVVQVPIMLWLQRRGHLPEVDREKSS